MFNHRGTMRWDDLSHQSRSLQVLVHNHSCNKIEQISAYWSPTIGKVRIGLWNLLWWWGGWNWGSTCERSLSLLAGQARNGGTHQTSTCGCSNTAILLLLRCSLWWSWWLPCPDQRLIIWWCRLCERNRGEEKEKIWSTEREILMRKTPAAKSVCWKCREGRWIVLVGQSWIWAGHGFSCIGFLLSKKLVLFWKLNFSQSEIDFWTNSCKVFCEIDLSAVNQSWSPTDILRWYLTLTG